MSFIGRCRQTTGKQTRCRNLITIGLYCEFHAGMLADEVRALARTMEAVHDEQLAERPTTRWRAEA